MFVTAPTLTAAVAKRGNPSVFTNTSKEYDTMKNNIKRKDNIKSVTLVIDAYDDRKLEIPLEVWQVDVICRMLGLSVDTANLDTYSMRSKEQVDEDMKMYYHILRNLHNKE